MKNIKSKLKRKFTIEAEKMNKPNQQERAAFIFNTLANKNKIDKT